MKKIILLAALSVILTTILPSCDNRPDKVLSKSEMEDVLYDFHITQGIINTLPPEQQKNAQAYLDALWMKHGISQEIFDSSMIYYNRHPKALREIYARLDAKYDDMQTRLQLETGNNQMNSIYSAGDTTNLWSGRPLYILRNRDILNKYTFSIIADTSFYSKDAFILTLTPRFIAENNELAGNDRLFANISITYNNGKTVGMTRETRSSDNMLMQLSATDPSGIKRITGFFYYEGARDTRNMCVISNISLVRMHSKSDTDHEAHADSLRVDSLRADSMRQRPDSIRKSLPSMPKVKPDDTPDNAPDIQLRSAPEIRHSNTFGPSRRKQQPMRRPQPRTRE